MLNVASIVIEKLYYLMNMNKLAFHADTTSSNESMNSLRDSGKKIILLID